MTGSLPFDRIDSDDELLTGLETSIKKVKQSQCLEVNNGLTNTSLDSECKTEVDEEELLP